MSTSPRLPINEADARPPRPGWAKALGVGHILVATLSSLALVTSVFWLVILFSSRGPEGKPSAMMGMDHPRYLWFTLIDVVTGLIGNALTFASGVALINLRPWGARIWQWLAPAKIVRLVLIWGGFIIGVAPVLASGMGRTVVEIIKRQGAPGRGTPTADELTLIYAWMFLATGIGMIVLGSIYPAITWWLVQRRGIQTALVEPTPALVEEVRQP